MPFCRQVVYNPGRDPFMHDFLKTGVIPLAHVESEVDPYLSTSPFH